MPHSRHQTQWAAQFAVASELCKRGYQVALTLGNHPNVDLMVRSPQGRQFVVDVKGLYKPAPFPIRPKQPCDDLFYILAYVPEYKPNEFFIMTQFQINNAIGFPLPPEITFPNVTWKVACDFRDKWDILPA